MQTQTATIPTVRKSTALPLFHRIWLTGSEVNLRTDIMTAEGATVIEAGVIFTDRSVPIVR